MTCHSDDLARVLARVTQGFVQGLHRSFLRVCKGCNGPVQLCLTYMCAHARLRMRVGLHQTLATLATLAQSKSFFLFINPLADYHCARVAQGLVHKRKGLQENYHDHTFECSVVAIGRVGGMCATACRPTCHGGNGADERRSVYPASRLRTGDRGGIDAQDRDGSPRSVDRSRVGRGDDAPLTATVTVAGPFRGVATPAVRLSAAFRCSDPISLYELRELNRSQRGVS